MRILQLTCEPIAYGGQEMYIKNLVSVLVQRYDVEVDVLTPYHILNKDMSEQFRELSVGVHELGLAFDEGKSRKNLIKALKHFFKTNKYDIVHIHSGSTIALSKAAFISKIVNRKKVYVHSHCATNNSSFKQSLLRGFGSLCFLLFANFYLSCSQSASEAKYSSWLQKKVKIFFNGIDVSKFSPNAMMRNHYRNKYNFSSNTTVVGFVGRFTEQKNVPFLIDVFYEFKKLLPESLLLIVGDGEQKNLIINRIDNLKLNSSVIFTGQIPNTCDVFNAMDCFVMPSRYEGLPFSAIEAQFNLMPCYLSSNIDPETVISSATYIISIEDSAKVWAKQIFETYKRCEPFIEDKIEKKFNICTCFDDLWKIYFS